MFIRNYNDYKFYIQYEILKMYKFVSFCKYLNRDKRLSES